MGLFTGEDVQAQPSWWERPWFLAFVVAGFVADMVVALITGMPELEEALVRTGLPLPAPTVGLIALGGFLARWWWIVVPPLVALPVLVAWRLGARAVGALKAALLVECVAFALLCLSILLPLKTIAEATP
jgi:type II secretory pathway component PulF